MGLEQPERSQTKLLSGWLGGLIGLGLYLRSFLWPDPQIVAVAKDELPEDDTENLNASRNKSALVAQKNTQDDSDRRPEDSWVEEGPTVVSFRYPVVLGRFESIFLEPFPELFFGAELPRVIANTTLPPFSLFPGRNNFPQNNSAEPAPPPTIPDRSGETEPDNPTNVAEEENPDPIETDPQDRNRAPRNSSPVYLGDVGSGAVLAISLAHLLSETRDQDGDLLGVSITGSSSGHMDPKGDGWRYFADIDALGEVEIAFSISDGAFSIEQTAILNVVENVFTGTDDEDLIVGTRGRDAIFGLDADDNLAGLGGRDRIYGGAGDDNISGGDGNDSLFGGDDDDLISGGDGDDWISGGAGDDRLYGEGGDDVIYGNAGNDEVYGGDGEDKIFGGRGDDTIDAGAGNDEVRGGADNDVLYGNAGDDALHGGAGEDQIFGGTGDDTVIAGAGDDEAWGEDGDDVIHGNAGDDALNGGDGQDQIFGGTGDDTVIAGAGDDEAWGEDGDDVIHGNAGDDALNGGAGQDQIFGGTGDDALSGGAGADQLSGDDGNDVIFSDDGDDISYGGAGNDVMFGGNGDDLLDGGDDDDIIFGDAGQDSLYGGDGNDILSGGADEDTVSGGEGDDIVIADDDGASDTYSGDAGHDQLNYSGATDSVELNLITGMASGASIGNDRFDGFEEYVGSTGDDHFLAGSGQASLTGNGGSDLYSFVQGDTVDIIRSIYQINDFNSDDRIWIGSGSGHREIRKAQRSLEDRIEDDLDDYADALDVDEPRLTYHYDWTDDYRRTIIEVDFDRDNTIDLELRIEGDHIIVIEHA
jgi:Ca2+-binding RTX toxin-like protein